MATEVRAEDLGYPSVEVIRARREAIERRHVEEIHAAAERRARGEGPPRRPLSEQTRERLRKAALDGYLKRVMADEHSPPLRKLRARKGLSAAALADLANVGVRSVFRAEVHPQNTSPRTWRRLADALGVEIDAIRP